MSNRELEFSAEILVQMVWIHPNTSDELVIECNYCGLDDAVFFQGNDTDAPESNWMAIAVGHMADNHQMIIRRLSKGS